MNTSSRKLVCPRTLSTSDAVTGRLPFRLVGSLAAWGVSAALPSVAFFYGRYSALGVGEGGDGGEAAESEHEAAAVEEASSALAASIQIPPHPSVRSSGYTDFV